MVRGKKTHKVRTPVSMTTRLHAELKHWMYRFPADQTYLFPSLDRKTHAKPGSQWFRDALKALKINADDGMERLVLHSCRSRYISVQLENNQNLFKVMQSVQHVSPQTTARYNRLVVSTSSREAASVLDGVAERRAEAKRKYEEEMAEISAHVEQMASK